MNRIKVVQTCLERAKKKTYLEIGVSRGAAFVKVHADVKIAVDPEFKIPPARRQACEAQPGKTYFFETTSDDFFARNQALLAAGGVDVSLVDGLHTYRQALQDVLNVLPHLADDGVIVMHDCRPRFASEARPAANHQEFLRTGSWWEIAWMGDVWKAVVELRSTRPDLRVAVLDCDCGVGIVRRGKPDGMLDYTPQAIAAMSYADLARDKQRLLNLRKPSYLQEFLS